MLREVFAVLLPRLFALSPLLLHPGTRLLDYRETLARKYTYTPGARYVPIRSNEVT